MKKIFSKISITLTLFLFSAGLVSAQAYSANGRDFNWLVNLVITTISYVIPLLTAAALLVFLWGVAIFILHSGDEDKVTDGKQLMFWGVIALTVLVSVWGIVGLLQSDLFGGNLIFPRLPERAQSTSI